MPHDNAQLTRVYLHARQVNRNNFYRRIAQETLDCLARDMTQPQGGFYSTQDAVSEAVDREFVVLTPSEVLEALGPGSQKFVDACGVTECGNFE